MGPDGQEYWVPKLLSHPARLILSTGEDTSGHGHLADCMSLTDPSIPCFHASAGKTCQIYVSPSMHSSLRRKKCTAPWPPCTNQ
jgi:hypothetical protein